MNDVQIIEAPWDEYRETLLRIRFEVFVDEQGVPPELERDAHDGRATHLLACDADGNAIATARMLDDGHIGRMAVLKPWRGRGVGTALMRRLIQLAADTGYPEVFLHAQCTAEPFYQRLGFVAEGGIYLDAGIDHRTMRMSLSVDSA